MPESEVVKQNSAADDIDSKDPILETLIREAFTHNYDVRIATARAEQARALAPQARSQFFQTCGTTES